MCCGIYGKMLSRHSLRHTATQAAALSVKPQMNFCSWWAWKSVMIVLAWQEVMSSDLRSALFPASLLISSLHLFLLHIPSLQSLLLTIMRRNHGHWHVLSTHSHRPRTLSHSCLKASQCNSCLGLASGMRQGPQAMAGPPPWRSRLTGKSSFGPVGGGHALFRDCGLVGWSGLVFRNGDVQKYNLELFFSYPVLCFTFLARFCHHSF